MSIIASIQVNASLRYWKEQLTLPMEISTKSQPQKYQWWVSTVSLIFHACSVDEIWWKFPLEIILLPHSGRRSKQLLLSRSDYCRMNQCAVSSVIQSQEFNLSTGSTVLLWSRQRNTSHWWRDLFMCNTVHIRSYPIEKFKVAILHLNRDWNHWSHRPTTGNPWSA